MAGRRRGRRANGPYRFTNNRRNALRRAQMISAKKRKRNAKITVGVLAAGAIFAYGGYKYGPGAKESVAKQVASFKPRMADMRNKMAAKIAVNPVVKEAVQKENALTQPPPTGRRRRRTPTATNPNPRTRNVTQIPPANPDAIRAELKNDLGLNEMGGLAARRQAERGYNNDLHQTIKDGPLQGLEKAIAGSRTGSISEQTARRYIGIREKTKVEAGGKAQTRHETNQEIAALIAEGKVKPRAKRTATRKKKGSSSGRQVRRKLIPPGTPASEQVRWTDQQISDAFGMEF